MKSPAFGAFIQRMLFSFLFLAHGVMHIIHWQGTVNMTGAVFGYGMGAIILSIIAVGLLLAGGLSIFTATMTPAGGWLLVFFLVGASYVHYIFAGQAYSSAEEQLQMSHFMKNIVLIGVALRYALGGNPKG